MKREFGRFHAPDPRDKLISKPRRKSQRRSKHWSRGPALDQKSTSACVGFAGAGYFAASPIRQRVCEPYGLYLIAQAFDEWPGDPDSYDGSSIRGLLKGCGPGRCGWISGYKFTFDINVLVYHILEKGPVLLGTDWYEGMMKTDNKGFIHPTGEIVGGHAYYGYGVSLAGGGYISIANSWGLDNRWGGKNTAKITLDEFDEYLLQRDGEAATPTEVRL